MSYDERTLAGACPVCGGAADVKEKLSDGELSSRTLTCRASYCCQLRDYWYDGKVFESHATVRERGFVTEGQDDADGTAAILNAIEAARDEFFDRPPEERAFLEAIRRDPLDRPTRLVFADWLEEHGRDDEAASYRRLREDVLRADLWMRRFALEVRQPYQELIDAGHAMRSGEVWCFGSTKAQDELLDEPTRREFWENWSLLTSEEVSPETVEETNFRCAC